MLWEFLKILVHNNGVLSSPQGDSTQAEKDIHSLLMTEQDTTWVNRIQSSNFLLPTTTKTDLEIRQALSEMQDLLIRGKKEEALRLALVRYFARVKNLLADLTCLSLLGRTIMASCHAYLSYHESRCVCSDSESVRVLELARRQSSPYFVLVVGR